MEEGTPTSTYEWQASTSPMSTVVRNTFIDFPLDHMLDERKVKSCPQSPVCADRAPLSSLPCLASSPLLAALGAQDSSEDEEEANPPGAQMMAWRVAPAGGAEVAQPIRCSQAFTGTVDAMVWEMQDAANIIRDTSTEVVADFNGTVDALLYEAVDAADRIREQGVVRAVSGSFAQAMEQRFSTRGAGSPSAGTTCSVAGPPLRAPLPFQPGVVMPQRSYGKLSSGGGSPLAYRGQPVAGTWPKSMSNVVAGAVDAVADELKDAANIIRERGVVRAVGGEFQKAMEQSLCCNLSSTVEDEGRVAVGAASSSGSEPRQVPALPPGNFGMHEDLVPSHMPKMKMPAAKARAKAMGSADIDMALLEMGRNAVMLGSAKLPSKGSALHGHGTCKPCAFAWSGGCKDGDQCRFCHLCQKGEKKRRRQVWKINKQRDAQDSSPFAAGSNPGSSGSDFQPFRGHCARLADKVEAEAEAKHEAEASSGGQDTRPSVPDSLFH